MTDIDRLVTLRFERMTADGRRAAVPVAWAARSNPASDWSRTGLGYDSHVAYPISAGDGRELTVTAECELATANTEPMYIRAQACGPSVLGDLAESSLEPGPAGARILSLPMRTHALGAATVGCAGVTWSWECSDDRIEWQSFDVSTHKVYLTVDHPALPWDVMETPTRVVPWRAVFDIACRWAAGETTVSGATAAVTRGLFAVGGQQAGSHTIRYGGGCSLYVSPQLVGNGTVTVFLLTSFLELIALTPGSATSLNCRDTAAALALVGSVLGCPLRVRRLCPTSAPTFRTLTIRTLGNSPNAHAEDFTFHEIAVLDGTDTVSDACLEVDLDDNPEQNPPVAWGLATEMPFDLPQPRVDYRARLIEAQQDIETSSVGDQGVVYPDVIPDGAGTQVFPCETRLRDYYRKLLDPFVGRGAPVVITPERFLPLLGPLDQWSHSTMKSATPARNHSNLLFDSWWMPVGTATRLRLTAVFTPSPAELLRVLLDMAVQFSVQLYPLESPGDLCLYCVRFDAIVFARKNVAIRLLNDLDRPVDLIHVATIIDQLLVTE